MGRTTAGAPLRVLGVQSSMADNGGLRVFLQLLDRWRAPGGASPVLFVVKHIEAGATPPVPQGLQVQFGSSDVVRSRYQAPQTLLQLARLARSSDVVVSGSEIGLSLLFGYSAARLARRPFVVLVHADLDDAIATWTPAPLRRLTRSVNARADAVVCVEGGLVDGVLRNGARPSAVRVVTNGIDVREVRRSAGLAPDGVESAADRGGVPVVVGNGRLAPQKGFDLLVEAHAKVLAAGFPHRLLITGEGPDRPALEALVRRLGVESSVDLPGFSTNPYPAMASADVFVLSSRSEGLPLTLLEAMAVGAPIIATECGSGPRRLLGDSEVGQLVPPDSADALARALIAHFREPGSLAARARGGPLRAREFDIHRAAAEHLEILRAVAA